jgi:glycosyltransferase involved in cell wall biosynthesis
VTTDAEVLSRRVEQAGVEPSRIVEIYFGVDPGIFNMKGRESGGDGPLRIVSTRNLFPVYGIDTLLEAFAEVRAACGASLVICGDGPQRGELEEKAAELSLGESAAFTGRLDQAGIAEQLAKADLYVSTSISDSTSVSLLEAMACGAVPVVTDLEANREWIRDGIGGILFHPGDARGLAEVILMLHGDRGLVSSMRDESAAVVKVRGLWLPNMEKAEKEFTRLVSGGKADS